MQNLNHFFYHITTCFTKLFYASINLEVKFADIGGLYLDDGPAAIAEYKEAAGEWIKIHPGCDNCSQPSMALRMSVTPRAR
jgi:hypothetical protein